MTKRGEGDLVRNSTFIASGLRKAFDERSFSLRHGSEAGAERFFYEQDRYGPVSLEERGKRADFLAPWGQKEGDEEEGVFFDHPFYRVGDRVYDKETSRRRRAGAHVNEREERRGRGVGVIQEAKNRPNIDWQDKIHRGILRGLRNISETP